MVPLSLQVAKKVSRANSKQLVRATTGRLEGRLRRKLVAVGVVEALSVVLDCLLCLAFSDLNDDRDPLGLLQQLATLRL